MRVDGETIYCMPSWTLHTLPQIGQDTGRVPTSSKLSQSWHTQPPQICRGVNATNAPIELHTGWEAVTIHLPSPPPILSFEYCSTEGFQRHKTWGNEITWQALTVLQHSIDVRWTDSLSTVMRGWVGGQGQGCSEEGRWETKRKVNIGLEKMNWMRKYNSSHWLMRLWLFCWSFNEML